MLNFAELRTPAGDGDVLIEPRAARWPALMEANTRTPHAERVMLAGVPLDEVRRRARGALPGAASDRPVIMVGHQPAYVHPGVWAKHVVVRHAAGRLGTAVNLVVDSDAPGTTGLAIPVVGSDGAVAERETALCGGVAGSAYEGRPPADGAAIENARRLLAEALRHGWRESMLETYLDGLTGAVDAQDMVAQHLAGRARVDRALEADLPEVRVSRISGGPFLADLVLDAERFAAAYNAAVDEYRREHRVRTPNRPVPDLERDAGRVETALWIYRPGQRRRRLWVRREGDRVALFADGQHVATFGGRELAGDIDAVLASLRPSVVRPRALTLTLWARLVACDLFVHGIGGAKYDRITDGIFRRYYRIEPPSYACVSATLRLPLPVPEARTEDLATARRRLRDLAYNPDRYVRGTDPELLAERRRLIRRSEALRRSRGSRLERRAVYQAIRRMNARIGEGAPELWREMAREVKRLERELDGRALAMSREYFYALQPADRLLALARRLIEAVHLPE